MQAIKKIWNIVTTMLVALVAVLAILLAGVRVFGLKPFTVLSGSMEPAYHVGSLIYVKDVEDTRAIAEGTVITYMVSDDTVVTHRVVAPVPDEEDPSVIRYRTKGDANNTEDGTLVHYKNIIGVPVYSIPVLGYVADFIQNPPGSYLALAAGALLLVMVFLPDLLFDEPKKAEQTQKAEGPENGRPLRKKGKFQK